MVRRGKGERRDTGGGMWCRCEGKGREMEYVREGMGKGSNEKKTKGIMLRALKTTACTFLYHSFK